MPFLDGRGLQWFTTLLKQYIGIPWSLSRDNDTEIDYSDNLNDYNTIGNYYCDTSGIASTLSNSPTSDAFMMKVYSGAGDSTNYMTQYVEDQYNNVWRRYKTSSLGDWGSWNKYSSSTSDTVGSSTKPVYVSNGQIVASSSTVGSGTKPMYLSSGTFKASSSTVGSSSTPVYLKSGTFTACTDIGNLSVTKSSFNEGKGYVVFSNGLIIQWGRRSTTGKNVSSGTTSYQSHYYVTFPVSFSSSSSYVIVKSESYNYYAVTDDCDVSFYDKSATRAYTWSARGGNENEEWLAIGY